MTRITDTMTSLETAEEFLEHFGIPYEQSVVDVHRLHILQRMHDRLQAVDLEAGDIDEQRQLVAAALAAAYQDFVVSDARTEKVFKVFQSHRRPAVPAGRAMVALAEIRGVSGQA